MPLGLRPCRIKALEMQSLRSMAFSLTYSHTCFLAGSKSVQSVQNVRFLGRESRDDDSV